MSKVVCENPRCGKRIPKHEAQCFMEDGYIPHYSCSNGVCIARAVHAVDEKVRDYQRFCEAIEQCK